MSDLISRQSAIVVLWKNRNPVFHDSADFEGTLFDITNLPSEQPEVIQCEDCKWRRNQNGTMAWIPCRALVTPDDFYCKYAERKEQ